MGLIFRVRPDHCTGCGNCEMACAFVHPAAGAPGLSRISVIRHGHERGAPIVCLQCDEAACVAACPSGALARNGATGAIDLDAGRCLRCRACVGACPFGNMLWDAAARLAAKCDLCAGRPQCVKYCPTGAIAYEPLDAESERALEIAGGSRSLPRL